MESRRKKAVNKQSTRQYLSQPLNRSHFPEDPYSLYNKKARHADEDFVSDCNESMDSLLVFAGLFSAVTTALIIETYKGLNAEPTDRIEQLLGSILLRMGNSSAPYHVNDIPPNRFVTSSQVILANSMLFLSLTFSLIAAISALLVKQWTRRIFFGLKGIHSKRDYAREHFFRMAGVKRSNMSNMIAAIPMLLHIALLFFFVGTLSWLSPLNTVVWVVVLVPAGLGFVIYVACGTLPYIWHDSPYIWPFSTLLAGIFDLVAKLIGGISQVAVRLIAYTGITSHIPLSHLSSHSVGQKQPVLHTHINRDSAGWGEDLPFSLDSRDLQIVSSLLDDAHTPLSIEAALEVIRRGLCGDQAMRAKMIALEGPSLSRLLDQAMNVLLGCRTYDRGSFDIRFGISLDRATFIMQFFEVSLETINFNIDERSANLPPLLEMAQLLMERALFVKSLDELCLHASVVARIQLKLGEFSHLDRALEVIQTIRLLGPSPEAPTEAPEPPPWSGKEIEIYQGAISAYFIALTRLIIEKYPTPQSSDVPQHLDKSFKGLADRAHTVLILGRFDSELLRQADNYILLRELFAELWLSLTSCSPEVEYWMEKLAMPLNWVIGTADNGTHTIAVVAMLAASAGISRHQTTISPR
ncbi:hypothetical protein FRC17_009580 [Serendipita sp. 399]|nr:hypothetical protein FRC17_009580 [Serendipita sp. 399]